MSEIKPWGYIHHSATRTLRDRALCNSTITKKATANSGMPLYTAAELAEAVAGERERCAKVCEGKASKTLPNIKNPSSADHCQIAWDACCDELAEAIRSATK